ncbi:MAG: AMP-binding protein [Anaerolineae bacterium]
MSIDPANDTAVFQFTGGTSGLPKAAELTHRNLVANIAQINAWVPSLKPGAEKFLLALPAFHVYGMTVGMLTCLKLGGELLLAPDPRNTLHADADHRPREDHRLSGRAGHVHRHPQPSSGGRL